jgi:hypothetical protein
VPETGGGLLLWLDASERLLQFVETVASTCQQFVYELETIGTPGRQRLSRLVVPLRLTLGMATGSFLITPSLRRSRIGMISWARRTRSWVNLRIRTTLPKVEDGMNAMAENDRDLIGRAESDAEKLYGEPTSVDEIADNFVLYGLRRRVAALETFDGELRGEIDSSPHSLRRRVQLMELRRKMGSVHEALRRARR